MKHYKVYFILSECEEEKECWEKSYDLEQEGKSV